MAPGPTQVTVNVPGELVIDAGVGVDSPVVELTLMGVVPPVMRNVNCVVPGMQAACV